MSAPQTHEIGVPERVYSLYLLYAGGTSLRSVGKQANLSGERVRQLFTRYGLATRSKSDHVQSCVRFLSVAEESSSLRETSKRTGLAEETIKHRLEQMGKYETFQRLWRMRQRHTVRRHFTDPELLQILRKLARELGRPPVQRDLDSIEGYPAHKTYVKRFGSLRAARYLAGLQEVNRCTRPMRINAGVRPLPSIQLLPSTRVRRPQPEQTPQKRVVARRRIGAREGQKVRAVS